MRPEDVNEENADKLWMTLYRKVSASKKPRFKVGDVVWVEKYYSGTRFKKGYEKNFTNELFEIVGVYQGDPNMYKINDIDTGDEITRKFYERELSKVEPEINGIQTTRWWWPFWDDILGEERQLWWEKRQENKTTWGRIWYEIKTSRKKI